MRRTICPLSPLCTSSSLYHRLSAFFEDNYKETAKERAERLKHLREQAEAQRRYSCINHLFESWDNDSSGYLELEELQMVIKTWKNFTDEQALLHGTMGTVLWSRLLYVPMYIILPL